MQKIWNSEADYNEKSNFSNTRVVSDVITLDSGVTSGYVRLRFDAGEIYEWVSLTWDDNWLYRVSKARVRIRTGDDVTLDYDDFSFSDSVSWSSAFVDSPVAIIDIEYLRNSRYIELELKLDTDDREYSIPNISNIILTYREDTEGPSKPEGVTISPLPRNLSNTFNLR